MIPTPNLASPRFKADPFPYFRRLRDTEPVARVRLPSGRPAWLVTRYDDVVALLRDARLSKDKIRAGVERDLTQAQWVPRIVRALSRNMLDVDDPDHRRLRSLVQKAFTPRVVEEMRGRIEGVADALLDRLRPGTTVDLIRQYALAIPVTVIADLLGVPPSDRERFHAWSNRVVAADVSSLAMARAIPSIVLFVRFIRRLIALRRREPGPDPVSGLVAAEDGGERLNDDELVAMIFLLLVAGHETTVNLIGNGVLALQQHPAQLERFRAVPALIDSTVEEMLRHSGPLQLATERYAVEDTAFGDVVFRRGELIYAALASANRDERRFPDPDAFVVDREPNKHVAFGFGIHHCLGAPLARLEGRIAVSRLMARFPDLTLDAPVSSLPWRPGLVIRGLRSLPVRI